MACLALCIEKPRSGERIGLLEQEVKLGSSGGAHGVTQSKGRELGPGRAVGELRIGLGGRGSASC